MDKKTGILCEQPENTTDSTELFSIEGAKSQKAKAHLTVFGHGLSFIEASNDKSQAFWVGIVLILVTAVFDL